MINRVLNYLLARWLLPWLAGKRQDCRKHLFYRFRPPGPRWFRSLTAHTVYSAVNQRSEYRYCKNKLVIIMMIWWISISNYKVFYNLRSKFIIQNYYVGCLMSASFLSVCILWTIYCEKPSTFLILLSKAASISALTSLHLHFLSRSKSWLLRFLASTNWPYASMYF